MDVDELRITIFVVAAFTALGVGLQAVAASAPSRSQTVCRPTG